MHRIIWLCFFSFSVNCSLGQAPLDPSFGNGGKITHNPDSFDETVDLLSRNDSLLLVMNAGNLDSTLFDKDIAVMRLTPDGLEDPTYGVGGVVKFDLPGLDYSEAFEAYTASDQSTLIAGSGYSWSNASFFPACVTKILPSGAIDVSFGSGGTAFVPWYGNQEYPKCLIEDSQGRILLAGATLDTGHSNNATAVMSRLMSDGTIDSSFGINGMVALDSTNGFNDRSSSGLRHLSGSYIYDILELDDGSYLIGGGWANGALFEPFFAHISEDGIPDVNFHSGGVLLLPIGTQTSEFLWKMFELPDGRILFGSYVAEGSERDFRLAIADLSTGAVDHALIDVGGNEDIVYDMEVSSTGELWVTGRSIEQANASDTYYRSDAFGVAYYPNYTNVHNGYAVQENFDTDYQDGADAVAVQSDGKAVFAGFVATSSAFVQKSGLFRLDPSVVAATPAIEKVEVEFQLYPNPAADEVHLAWVGSSTEALDLTCFSSDGRLVFQQQGFRSGDRLMVSDWPEGVYFITLENVQGVFHHSRVVVQH